MKFRMVEELAMEQQDVGRCCKVLKVSRGGYYGWLVRPESQRATKNAELARQIRLHWEKSRGTYGAPRIMDQLKKTNVNVGKRRVARIMRENGIQGAGKRKFKVVTTDSNHDLPIADRVFETEKAAEQVTEPNQFWGGDITYVATAEGWLYLAIFLDLFTRKVVGHSMSESMEAELVINALEMGLSRQGLTSGEELVAHTDRGSQYAAKSYRDRLAANNIGASMSRGSVRFCVSG